MENAYQIKLGHGRLYPLLNALEKSGYIQSTKEKHEGRIRKTYQITPKGSQIIEAYNEILKQQITEADLKGTEKT